MNVAVQAPPKLRTDVVQGTTPVVRATFVTKSLRPQVAVLTGIMMFVLINGLLFFGLESGSPSWRDPEYGVRLEKLRALSAVQPLRPLAVILGSSRTAQGIRPDVYEEESGSNTAPLLFNMSQSGGGPISQLMTFRRLLADGITPHMVILEYWPPHFRGDGSFHEQHRLDAKRLRPVDERTVRECFADPELAWNARQGESWCPVTSHRRGLLMQLDAGFIPTLERTETMWTTLDAWGWWPGRIGATPEQIAQGWHTIAYFYRPLYQGYHIEPTHDLALRKLLSECQRRSVPVMMVQLPESQRFQEFKTGEAQAATALHLNQLEVEFGVPLHDFQRWAPDDDLPDGFHLTQSGARRFTTRFVSEAWRPWFAEIQTHFPPRSPRSH